MDNLKLLSDFVDAVWHDRDPSAVSRFFAPEADLQGFDMGFEMRATDFTTFSEYVLMLVDSPRITILKTVVDSDWISALMRCDAVARSNGRRIEVYGQTMMKVQDGLILQVFNHFDILGFLVQLGFLPENTLEKALCERDTLMG